VDEIWDVAVVGSGPAGALAAAKLLDSGCRVLMLDVANDDPETRGLIPDVGFSELRHNDANQRRYFLGDQLEGVPSGEIKVGAQLTPPRQFVTRGTEEWLPTSGDDFEPMQSLALGGLGAAWGAASFTWNEVELQRVGLRQDDFSRHYDEVARRIGISADPEDDASAHCFQGVHCAQPPLELDSGAKRIWKAYAERREELLRDGFRLGRTPLAALSRDLEQRRANPLFDMDFWSESRQSVFRPRYLVESLERNPNFHLQRGTLVQRFENHANDVSIAGIDVVSRDRVEHRARRVMLCAGALNSARIALHSLGAVGVAAPLLCNPYVYLPCLNLHMLGRAAEERRHSLSQLIAIYTPPDAPNDAVSVQLYGYRSLLLFKLAKEMPLPAWAGLQVSRLLMNAVTIAGLHHSDAPSADKTLTLVPRDDAALPELQFRYETTPWDAAQRRTREKNLSRSLRRLGVLPYGRIAPGAASSIHYAGTLPMRDSAGEVFASRADGRLWAAPRVYVGDSAGFRWLPAKGLTFTIMANAVRTAERVQQDLASEA
jgi:choline dehydrogenase-like flavoprotein